MANKEKMRLFGEAIEKLRALIQAVRRSRTVTIVPLRDFAGVVSEVREMLKCFPQSESPGR